MNRITLQFLLVIIIMAGCKEDFAPPVIQKDINYLVVDGFLNNSSDTTFIRLSRTKKLDQNVRESKETGAQLFVEDENANTLYSFTESSDSGKYFVPGMNLSFNQKYRLRIITTGGAQYLSEEINVIKTPAIDSISFGRLNNSLAIYANTHDPLNNTRYYRWEYTETWHYRAAFFSSLISENGGIFDRPADKYIFDCWKTQDNKQILLGSSAILEKDIIYHFPVRIIDINAVELSIKYFILLRQYALTKEAYTYTENLKKITEQTGSLFDAQPSEINGNIHSVENPGETVLGYLTACTRETKQLYITNEEVQPWDYRPACVIVEIPIERVAGSFNGNSLIPLSFDGGGPSVKGVYATSYQCGDCTSQGGVTTKPPFWQ
ncbi:MAG: DUF4249 domain-containing protein [Bacteroidetes bacterium]|nr:DUF4249 domain-containing protein [Bacteroidota bacterium]